MKNKLNLMCLILLAFVLAHGIVGCSKDDADNGPQVIEGGQVSRYQSVILEIPNRDLTENEYQANFGNLVLRLNKIDTHQLAFLVPFNAELGANQLLVNELNLTVNYQVLETILPQAPEEVIQDLFDLGDDYMNNHPELSQDNNYEKAKNYFLNQASEEDKNKMALCYYANKEAFDQLILYNPEISNGRFTSDDAILFGKFLGAVGGGGASIWVMYSQVPADPAGAILAAGAAYFFYTKAKSFGVQIVELYDIKTIGFNLGGQTGVNERNSNSVISLSDNVASQLSFQLRERALTQNDQNTTNTIVSNFFEKLDYLNDFINKTNTAINWVNENVPLVNFSNLDNVTLSTNPSIVTNNIDSSALQNINLSINHPNLELVNYSVTEDQKLNIKVKITGNPSQVPVESRLDYSYNDGLSQFSGYFNIKVNQEVHPLLGSWSFLDANNLGINIWNTGICPRYRFLEGGGINFTETQASSTVLYEFEGTQYDSEGNEECAPIENMSFSFSGAYQEDQPGLYSIPSGTFTGDDGVATMWGTIEILEENLIKATITVDYGDGDLETETIKYIRN